MPSRRCPFASWLFLGVSLPILFSASQALLLHVIAAYSMPLRIIAAYSIPYLSISAQRLCSSVISIARRRYPMPSPCHSAHVCTRPLLCCPLQTYPLRLETFPLPFNAVPWPLKASPFPSMPLLFAARPRLTLSCLCGALRFFSYSMQIMLLSARRHAIPRRSNAPPSLALPGVPVLVAPERALPFSGKSSLRPRSCRRWPPRPRPAPPT